MPNVRFKVRTQRRPAQFSRAATASQKDDRIETCTVGHHLFETMCPTAFLAPTLLRFVSSAFSHKVGFFWPNLRCKVIEKVVPWSCSRPKKKNQNGSKIWAVSKRILLLSGQKKSQNWTGPWLSLNMVNGNRFNKWQTPLRCQMFVSRCEPNAAQPNSAVRRPPARKTIESKRVLWGAFNLMVKKLYFQGPKICNPISSSKCIALAPHAKVLRTTMQY